MSQAQEAYSDLAVYQESVFCANCGGPQIFIQVFEFAGGRAGYCVGCDAERFILFTRTTAEAA